MKTIIVFLLAFFLLSDGLLSQNKLLSKKDLEGKTLEEIYFMKHEIYARHGKKFSENDLYHYFENCSWYQPSRRYNDNLLTATDKSNLKLLSEKEAELLKSNYIGTKKINEGNIINKWQVEKFSNNDKTKLLRNGFLIVPAEWEQFFYIYSNNDYENIGNFITTDAILQLYHMFFDYTLRELESRKLLPILQSLNKKLLESSIKTFKNTNNSLIKDASFRNIFYFTVADSLLFLAPEMEKSIKNEWEYKPPEEFEDMTSEELNSMIKKILGRVIIQYNYNPINDTKFIPDNFDLSMFKVRGHYTKTPKLRVYFRAMMWYGLYSFEMDNKIKMLQSMLIASALYNEKYYGNPLIDLWNKIYEPTAFYVGISDDVGPDDYKKILDKVFIKYNNAEAFLDEIKFNRAVQELKQIWNKKSRIRQFVQGESQKPQFRLMGQRYLPDAEITQRLTKWPIRNFPNGLDIPAAFGSELAKSILLDYYKEGKNWFEYPVILDSLIKQFSSLTESQWKQNLYYYWLWCLKALYDYNHSPEMPFFMRNDAYKKKCLSTALGSWAELRHDVILYGEQSVAEAGDDEGEWKPEPPKGYVEPNLVFWNRLKGLLEYTKKELNSRKILDKALNKSFDEFGKLLSFLIIISEKEIKKEAITKEEYKRIAYIGSELEHLTLEVARDENNPEYFNILSEADQTIAIIADIHSSNKKYLEVGVGPAYNIYAVVEIDGYLRIVRGGVFSYYEFISDKRLTNEEWRSKINNREVPEQPDWLKDIISEKKFIKDEYEQE